MTTNKKSLFSKYKEPLQFILYLLVAASTPMFASILIGQLNASF